MIAEEEKEEEEEEQMEEEEEEEEEGGLAKLSIARMRAAKGTYTTSCGGRCLSRAYLPTFFSGGYARISGIHNLYVCTVSVDSDA